MLKKERKKNVFIVNTLDKGFGCIWEKLSHHKDHVQILDTLLFIKQNKQTELKAVPTYT